VQKLTIYASAAATDPGWDLSTFTALGTVDTKANGKSKAAFTAASLRAVQGEALGNFRWIIWSVSPINNSGGGENTAFQEFAVDIIK
jgi:hypothetical protein